MQINGKEIELKITGKTLILFKQEFKKDMFAAIRDLNEEITNVFEIMYILAKQSDAEFQYKNYDEFMENVNIGDILNEDAMKELTSVLEKSLTPSKEIKKKVTKK